MQDKAREVADQAQQKAQGAAQQARGRVRDQVDQRSTQAGDQVRNTANDVRSVAQELRNQGKDTPARYAEQAAERAERAGDYLRDRDGDAILRDVEDFARRNTWAVVAGGIALGFAASRLLKASSTERYRSSQANGYGTYRSTGSLAREPMPSGATTTGGRFEREAGFAGDPATVPAAPTAPVTPAVPATPVTTGAAGLSERPGETERS